MESTTEALHIVYVHGFQGDHTTFQSFPSDLHHHLLPTIPQLQTWVYPTYKSSKPLSFAVENLLKWISSLPDGPVILAGHSMGGLLVAEAALNRSPVARRINGILAFDAPYLGMHPHVVVSGIASLFPKKPKGTPPGPPTQNDATIQTEASLNNEDTVNFVTSADAFPIGGGGSVSTDDLSSSKYSTKSPTDNSSMIALAPPARPSSSKAASSLSDAPSSIVAKATLFLQKHADDPFVHFLNKHSDAPVTAMYRWVVEYLEFGFAMFDYGELWDRYKRLEKWNGHWINFWTVTDGEDVVEEGEPSRPPTPSISAPLSPRGLLPKPPPGIGTQFESEFEKAMKKAANKRAKAQDKVVKAAAKARAKATPVPELHIEEVSPKDGQSSQELTRLPRSGSRSPSPHHLSETEKIIARHFITLPWSSKGKWVKVKVAGVEDEVGAHCGIFIKNQNLEYERFVERVGDVVKAWLS